MKKISIHSLLFLVLTSCGSNDPVSINDSTGISDEEIPNEQIPTEGFLPECNQDLHCNDEELCFEGTCQHYIGFVYKVTVVKYIKIGDSCADYVFNPYLDKKPIPVFPKNNKTSSIATCGGSWPNEWFEMVGDQIPEIAFWKVGLFNKKIDGVKTCWYENENCIQFPLKVFKAGELKQVNKLYDIQLKIEPIKSLAVKL